MRRKMYAALLEYVSFKFSEELSSVRKNTVFPFKSYMSNTMNAGVKWAIQHRAINSSTISWILAVCCLY